MKRDSHTLRKPIQFWDIFSGSLIARVIVIFILLLGVLLASTVILMETLVSSYLARNTGLLINQAGNTMVAELQKRIMQTEVLTTGLADIGETLKEPNETSLYQIRNLINHRDAEEVIAGGGIWPEPFAMNPNKERASMFWGRDETGELLYFDDYNNPDEPGYHPEEWYVPARFIDQSEVYWSRSYMDPYSLEPMVTCTAPMYVDNEFRGVATIDLKLSGISDLLRNVADKLNGYAFVVDRNSRLLSLPPGVENMDIGRGDTYPTMEELALALPTFLPVLEYKEKILRSKLHVVQNSQMHSQTSSQLLKGSNMITANEAMLITASVYHVVDTMHNIQEPFVIDNDYWLGEPSIASFYHVPETDWYVIMLLKESAFNGDQQSFYARLVGMLASTFTVAIIVAILMTYRSLFKPLLEFKNKLKESVLSKQVKAIELTHNREDEIGDLAYWFNQRSQQLEELMVKLKTSEAQALEADRAKGQFLATMTHEIRTPINGIIGFSNLLNHTKLDDEQLEYVKLIVNSGDNLLVLIEDILDFSKIESDNMVLDNQPYSLESCIEEIQRYMSPVVKAKGLDFIIDIAPEAQKNLVGDKNRLRQVILNLATNAVKFTHKGSVRIKVMGSDKCAQKQVPCIGFWVEDTGIGIPPEKIPKLFRPFEQGDKSTIRKFGGSGLGLVICKRIVELMGGEIYIDTEYKGGTRVCFHIPVVHYEGQIDEEHRPLSIEAPKLADKFPLNILVAEDVATNRKLLKVLLNKIGYRPKFVENGRQVLEILKTEKFDLILMDHLMPEMDGVESAKRIRAGEAGELNQFVSICAVTANAFTTSRDQCIEAGMNHFISKPIKLNELIKCIEATHEKLNSLVNLPSK